MAGGTSGSVRTVSTTDGGGVREATRHPHHIPGVLHVFLIILWKNLRKKKTVVFFMTIVKPFSSEPFNFLVGIELHI